MTSSKKHSNHLFGATFTALQSIEFVKRSLIAAQKKNLMYEQAY